VTVGMNQNSDPPCNSVGHPSCYSKGFADGESAAGLGTSCASSGHSFGYCEGYNQGSGFTNGHPLQQQLTR
jgi:hypothetical protein